MAARGGRSRDRTGTRTRREAGAGRWLEPALVLTRELVLLAGTLTVLVAFCRPWLVVETAPLAEALLGLPASESLPAWRLPGYARRVDQAWRSPCAIRFVTLLSGLCRSIVFTTVATSARSLALGARICG